MTRADISRRVAAKTNISIEAADRIVLEVIDSIIAAVECGNTVYLRGFGTFTTVSRAPRKGRDIDANKVKVIPETVVPVFIPSQVFKNKVKR